MATEDAITEQSGGLLKFFRLEGDIVERLVSVPAVRKYASDASFVAKLRETQTAALKATTPEEIAEITRSLMRDPRLTQCAMLGAGVNLAVGAEDLKKAEREGDIAKPSPLKVDDLVEAESVGTADEARTIAKNAYLKGDVPKALAHWTRVLRLTRTKGLPDDIEEAAAIYGNISQGLVKLGHYVRAEQAATRSLAYVARARDLEKKRQRKQRYRGDDETTEMWDATACERKALYRRALALEGQRKFEAALRDARAANDTDRRLVSRLEALVESEKKLATEKVKRRAEEKEGFQKRGAGVPLKQQQRDGGTNAPGASVGYVDERDYSAMALRRLKDKILQIDIDLGQGASVRVDSIDEAQSSVSATVNVKRGNRAMYYDVDLVANWTGDPEPEFDLSNDDKTDRRSISGTVRLYNVSHETRYEPGADPNVAYMYQLGYRGIKPAWFDGTKATQQAPDWVKRLIDGAHNLYEAMANNVDAVINDVKTQLDNS